MFIVDFDDTLFDTQRFKQERLNALRTLGVSDELYWETYARARNDEGGRLVYTDERHVAAFAGKKIDTNKVQDVLVDMSTTRVQEFLFPDAISFLKKLRAFGQSIVLLSLGAPSFQETKVRGTGVDQYVDEVIIRDSSKEGVLSHHLDQTAPENLWFINDKIDETQQMMKHCPSMRAILKRVSTVAKEQYEQIEVPFFDSLSDIAIYVEQHI